MAFKEYEEAIEAVTKAITVSREAIKKSKTLEEKKEFAVINRDMKSAWRSLRLHTYGVEDAYKLVDKSNS